MPGFELGDTKDGVVVEFVSSESSESYPLALASLPCTWNKRGFLSRVP